MVQFVEDRRGIGMRLSLLRYLMMGVFSVLAVSFWVLQVAQHARFEEMAENNHQRTLALRAPRGIVFDRHGKVLVDNRASYSISILREHTKDLSRTVRMLAAVLNMDEGAVRVIVDRHRLELPDVVVEQVPTRSYPETMGAHLFGYVGEVSDDQISHDKGLKSGDIIGKSGIEKVYNARLMGEDGARRVVVNSIGREIRTLEEDAPTEGHRVQLTIDYDLQKAIEDGFDSIKF